MEFKNSRIEKREKMFKLIKEYLSSDLTQPLFCEKHSIPYQRFQWWLKKYRKTKNSNADAKNIAIKGFIPLQPITPQKNNLNSQHLYTIEYPNGIILHINREPAPELLLKFINSAN